MRNILLVVLMSFSVSAFAEEIHVAAAADLKFALEQIVQKYQAENAGEKVIVTYGASGVLATQIKSSAPFDLFFSADTESAQAVVDAGHAEGKTFPYASAVLAVWVKNDSKLILDKDLKFLTTPTIKKIAIANPAHAPYGKLAEAALKKSSNYEKVFAKLVLGENVAQAAQFAESGAADVGLIAASLANSPQLAKEGHSVEVDHALYPELIQSGVIVKSKKTAAAKKFQAYFLSEKGRGILKEFHLNPAAK